MKPLLVSGILLLALPVFALDGQFGIHDHATVTVCDGKYYTYGTGGNPLVFTPDDAYRCFVNTEMDYLAIGSFLLERTVQPARGVKPSFHPVPD